MIGQEALKKELFTQSLANTHKTILLLGDYGCGKHTLAKELASHFSLDLYDLTETISAEVIESIQFSSVPAFYLVNLDDLNERAQNVILKFIEEPVSTAYILLLSSNENYVIPTIMNRCYVCKFAPYTKEELEQIIGSEVNPELLDVCSTPGQIRISMNNFDKLKELCYNIRDRLNRAGFGNALSIVNKINYKDEYDKFDLNVFLKVLMKELYVAYATNNNTTALKLYNIVEEHHQRLVDVRLNKEIFMQHLMTVMWKACR